MKQLTLLFVLIASFFVHGQQAKYTVDQHTWAGGVCCSGGTDYTIVLQFPAKRFTCFDSLRLETHGVLVTIADSEFHQARYGDSLMVFSLKFGSSYYERPNAGMEGSTNHYGIDGNRLKWTGIMEDSIVLLRGKKEEVLEGVVATESMTAYP